MCSEGERDVVVVGVPVDRGRCVVSTGGAVSVSGLHFLSGSNEKLSQGLPAEDLQLTI